MTNERKSLTEMVAETAREAGVLIFVFGLLDALLDDVPHGVLWYSLVLAASALALAMGYTLELKR